MDELTDYEKALRAWAKYAVIENTSNREMPNIVDCVGKFWVRNLKREEIATLARDSNKEGIPKEHLKRYYAADIIAEAVEPDGVPCYVEVEVWYRQSSADTSGIRNTATLLSRFTGKSAYPVIAGTRVDNATQELIDDGQIHFYELEEMR